MKSNSETNDVSLSSDHPLGDTQSNVQLKSECERLQQRIGELEKERERDCHRLAELEAERDHYRAEALAWARKEFERRGIDEEDLKRRIEQEDGLPLEAFLSDLSM
jgi:hypothetical protein